MKTALLVALVLLLVLAAVFAFRGWRFELATQDKVARLGVAGAARAPERLALDTELAGLPAPVQRYLRAVLTDGMPLPRQARIAHAGEFLMKPPAGWAPFVSVEHFAAQPPGFVWDARIDMAPAMPVKVRDAFVDGAGSMQGAIWGVIPVVDVVGTPDIAQGALVRYLAEAPWFPVALLPSRGVRWTALDEHRARATLTAGTTTATVDFTFDAASGLVTGMYCASRMRDVDGRGVPTPWQGRMADYAAFGALRVPLRGEVAWVLPEGEQVYWRGRVTDARYE